MLVRRSAALRWAGAPGIAPGSAAKASSCAGSWPGASTNVGSSWRTEQLQHGGRRGTAVAQRRDAALRRGADPAVAAGRRSAATTRASAVRSRRPGRSPRCSRSAGGRRARSPSSRNTGCSPEPSTSMVPRQVVARSSQRSTRGSIAARLELVEQLGDLLGIVLDRRERERSPAGPSSARRPARPASTRASGACSAQTRIQCRPRRSRRSSTSCASEPVLRRGT